jgi:hypothetical protein
MSRATWQLMVKVAQQKDLIERPKQRRRPRTKQLVKLCVREDHYALLLAAAY